MHVAVTPDQEALRREVRSFLEARYPLERVAELADSAEGWDADSWAELAELGWLGVTVAEDRGGAGLSFVEQAIVFEELGRALYPGPYFSTVGLALAALPPELQEEVAKGETRWSMEVDGLVPDLGAVDRVLVRRFGRVLAVAAEGDVLETMDSTRRLGRLRDGLEGEAEDVGSAESFDRARVRAFAALAAEAVGIAQRALEWAVEHAKTREQFGRPIGVYQAISHPIAQTYVETELARSLALWAAWCVDEDEEQAPLAAAAAKSFAAEKSVAACERSIQVHGGIGFTWEHPLHRYYKRAQWIESFGGYPAAQRAEVAAALLGG